MRSIAKRIMLQVIGDKRSIMLIAIAPLVILTFLYFLLGNSQYTPTIGVSENTLQPALVSSLKAQDANIVDVPDKVDAKQYLTDHKDIDVIFSMSSSGTQITMYESSSKTALAVKAIQSAVASLNPAAQTTTSTVIGQENASFFNSMGYIFLGLFSFFLIFLISGMSFVKERSSGTMERFLMSPISRNSVIWGYTGGYGVFAIVQAILMTLFGVYVLGITCVGNIVWAVLIMLLLSVSAVAFGALISVFSRSELQVVQLIPIAIVPQVFFSGLIPLDTIPYGLGNLCYLTPIYYGTTALKQIMEVGSGIGEIWPYVLGLVVYILVLNLLNTLALKKYRKL
jgi:ABC-2 type transport system permease protein